MNDIVMASLEAVVLSRAAERILLVLVGALAVYLGYSLFRNMPTVDRSEGKFELPGGVSIFLSRIGPGVFFALFGCAIIGYSVTKPVALTLPQDVGAAIEFSGFGQVRQPAIAAPAAAFAIAGIEPELAVARLNSLLESRRANASAPEFEEFEEAVRAAKFALMLSGWKSEWGEPEPFRRWAEENGDRDPPDDMLPGATLVWRTAL